MKKIKFFNLRITYPFLVVILLSAVVFCSSMVVLSNSGDALYASADNVSTAQVIVIDAGHGGEDCGAIGANGIYEKDLNLEISMLLGESLSEKGFTVVYTRTEDKMLYKPEENIKGIRKISDLKNRCEVASKYDDAIFISIHMNSFGEEKYSGAQIYYSVNNEACRVLAEAVQKSIRTGLQPDNTRTLKQGNDIYVLKNLSCPAILIECGFLSNKEECESLCEKEYQKRLSFSIVCGIIEYIEKIS